MEKLRKVNSFSELKVGQIVVVKNCRLCKRAKCRTMLIKYVTNQRSFNPISGKNDMADGFRLLPQCSEAVALLTNFTLNQGRLFLVEDGLEDMDGVEDVVVKKLETVE